MRLFKRYGTALLMVTLGVCSWGCGRQRVPSAPQSVVPLALARQRHTTQLIRHGPSPQPYDHSLPPGVKVVHYESAGRQLMAWIAIPSGRGPHPALLYAHGGYALASEDFEDVRPFVQAGYVVMTPTWRGENGNPGDFEMSYGEVEDALAALDYLAKQPEVDRNRLFAAGHSAGGTIAILLAESTPDLRGAAACGAFPDVRSALQQYNQPIQKEAPYDWHDAQEAELRSPARYLADLQCPLSLFNSDRENLYIAQAKSMAEQARNLHRSVTVEVIANTDHYTALAPAVQKMIAKFNTL
jgi:dipeptidyl aminopeptidase/acylaminoacyl peptidase